MFSSLLSRMLRYSGNIWGWIGSLRNIWISASIAWPLELWNFPTGPKDGETVHFQCQHDDLPQGQSGTHNRKKALPSIFQMEKLRQRSSDSHAKPLWPPLSHLFFGFELEKKNREGPAPISARASFTMSAQGITQQSNCQEVELIHLFQTNPNKLSWLLSLKNASGTVPQECHKTKSPRTAVVHIVNVLFVCKRMKSLFLVLPSHPHPLLILSSTCPRIKSIIKQRDTQVSEIQCTTEET